MDRRALSYYNEDLGDWFAPTGVYELKIGSSSRDIRLTAKIDFKTDIKLPFVADENTVFGEFMHYPEGRAAMEYVLPKVSSFVGGGEAFDENASLSMMESMPIRQARSFGGITDEVIEETLRLINEAFGGKKACKPE